MASLPASRITKHMLAASGENTHKHLSLPKRHLLEEFQDSFSQDLEYNNNARYLHDVCASGTGFHFDDRICDWPESVSSGTSGTSDSAKGGFEIDVAAASIPVPLYTGGKHLHIPANVTLRAERRTRRAYSWPQQLSYDVHQESYQQHNEPDILEESPPPPGPDEVRPRVERSLSQLSVASFALRGTTKREKLILASLALVDFLSNMCLSILAPFFPKEARNRNINDTLSGWIFGVFALVQFLTSPVFGKMLSKVGSRFLFISGIFIGGGGTVLFGALYYFPYEKETTFLAFCFVLRVFIGLGCTASNTASFAIMADTFPDNVGSVFGILETFTGLGLMVGPALGGVLYQAGGFFLPFCVLGGIMLTGVPLCSVILPKENEFETIVAQGTASGSYRNLLRMPIVLAVCSSVMCAALVWSLLDPVLEPHLKIFKLSTAIIGLIFLLSAAFYAVSAPLWGWITDKVRDSCILLSLGFFFSSIAFLFLGPSQLLGFDEDYNELWLNLLSLIVLGLSVSLASVPTFEKILDVAEQEGIEDGLMLYGTAAGIWGSANALGEFIGPSIGGTLVGTWGFSWTMTVCSGICLFMAFVNFICWCYHSSCCKRRQECPVSAPDSIDENTPLLNPLAPGDVTGPLMTSSNSDESLSDPSDESYDSQTHREQRYFGDHNANDESNDHKYDRRNSSKRSRTWDYYHSC